MYNLIIISLRFQKLFFFAGRLYHEACVIPIYMPITLSIAAAMQTGCHKHFYKTMLEMYNFVNSVPKEVAFPRLIRECDGMCTNRVES